MESHSQGRAPLSVIRSRTGRDRRANNTVSYDRRFFFSTGDESTRSATTRQSPRPENDSWSQWVTSVSQLSTSRASTMQRKGGARGGGRSFAAWSGTNWVRSLNSFKRASAPPPRARSGFRKAVLSVGSRCQRGTKAPVRSQRDGDLTARDPPAGASNTSSASDLATLQTTVSCALSASPRANLSRAHVAGTAFRYLRSTRDIN